MCLFSWKQSCAFCSESRYAARGCSDFLCCLLPFPPRLLGTAVFLCSRGSGLLPTSQGTPLTHCSPEPPGLLSLPSRALHRLDPTCFSTRFLVFISTCLSHVPPLLQSLVLVYVFFFLLGLFFICQTLSPTSCSILLRYRWPFLWAAMTRRALTTPPCIVVPCAPVFSPYLHCISVESNLLALKFPAKKPNVAPCLALWSY